MIEKIKLETNKDSEPEIIIVFKTNMTIRSDFDDLVISNIKQVNINEFLLDVSCYNDLNELVGIIGFKTYYENRTIMADNWGEGNDEMYLIEDGEISKEVIKMLTGFNNMKDIGFYILKREDYKYITKVLKEHKHQLNYDTDYAGWYIENKTLEEYLFEEENTYLNPKELGEVIEDVIENELKLKR